MDYLLSGLLVEDTLADIANTLFWPLVISLGVRLRPLVVSHEEPVSGSLTSASPPASEPGGPGRE